MLAIEHIVSAFEIFGTIIPVLRSDASNLFTALISMMVMSLFLTAISPDAEDIFRFSAERFEIVIYPALFKTCNSVADMPSVSMSPIPLLTTIGIVQCIGRYSVA